MQDLSQLGSCADMCLQMKRTLECTRAEHLEERKSSWKQCVGAANQVREACGKATKAVNDYIKTQERQTERKRKLELQKLERQEREATKRKQAEAASRLNAAAAPKEWSLFLAGALQQTSVQMTSIEQPPATTSLVDSPWRLKENPSVRKWMSSPRVQLALASFGGSYKKNPQYKDALSSGQVQLPMLKGKGSLRELQRHARRLVRVTSGGCQIADGCRSETLQERMKKIQGQIWQILCFVSSRRVMQARPGTYICGMCLSQLNPVRLGGD